MKTSESADVVIAGAGCAGLSLAVRLVQAGVTERRILLIDPRPGYRQDRTWCFWNTSGPTPFDGAVTHAWDRWRVAADGGEEVIRSAPHFSYQHLPSDRFYEAALGILRGFANVEVRLGCPVEAVRDEGPRVRVTTGDGEVTAGVVFDSRPCGSGTAFDHRVGRGRRTLLQHFLGVRVRADRDVFDPKTATLMDFRVSQKLGIHFLYVLPYSEREALLEATFISPAPLARGDYLAALDGYRAARFPNAAFTVLDEETGVIPMGTGVSLRRPASPRVIPAGIAGGMAKPSTGYAFLAIQRWSEDVARQMAGGAEIPRPPAPRTRRASLMDGIFLAYLREHPEDAPALFTRMFRNTAPDRLVRFLSDAGSPLDDLAVIHALPKPAFLRQAFSELRATGFGSHRVRAA